jgi:hypothetical protein
LTVYVFPFLKGASMAEEFTVVADDAAPHPVAEDRGLTELELSDEQVETLQMLRKTIKIVAPQLIKAFDDSIVLNWGQFGLQRVQGTRPSPEQQEERKRLDPGYEPVSDAAESPDPGYQTMSLRQRLRTLFADGKCSFPEVVRMSLASPADAKLFVESREPIRSGSFTDGREFTERQAERRVNRMFGKK